MMSTNIVDTLQATISSLEEVVATMPLSDDIKSIIDVEIRRLSRLKFRLDAQHKPSKTNPINLEDFNFSVRLHNILKREGLVTIYKILAVRKSEYLSFRGFGNGCLVELVDTLYSIHLKLKD